MKNGWLWLGFARIWVASLWVVLVILAEVMVVVGSALVMARNMIPLGEFAKDLLQKTYQFRNIPLSVTTKLRLGSFCVLD